MLSLKLSREEPGTSVKWCIYPEIKTLLAIIGNNERVTTKLSTVDAGYYREECGCCGWHGSDGLDHEEVETIDLPKKDELLIFSIVIKKEDLNKFDAMAKRLYITPGAHHTLKSFNSVPDRTEIEVVEYKIVKKKPFFDELYKKMKEFNIVSNIDEMVRYKTPSYENYNSDFVLEYTADEEPDEEDDSIISFEEVDNIRYEELNTVTFSFRTIVSDIETNTGTILEIINAN